MPTTYEPIATTTLGSDTASITFTSITSTYTDLVLVLVGNAASDVSTTVQFNSDTGSNYSQTLVYGDGSVAGSGRGSNRTSIDLGTFYNATSTTPQIHIININNYSNSTTYKTTLSRGTAVSIATQARVGLWRSTAAITSIKLAPDGVNFKSGTIATLYGIKAA